MSKLEVCYCDLFGGGSGSSSRLRVNTVGIMNDEKHDRYMYIIIIISEMLYIVYINCLKCLYFNYYLSHQNSVS